LTIDWNFNWNLDPYNNPPPPPQPQQPAGGYDWNWDWNLDPYNNPAPQPASVYTPAPAPVANPWDFNGNQPPPAYQQQTPFQVPTPTDPFSVVNQFVGNAAQNVDNQTNYFDSLWQSVADPWQAPAKANMNPFEWVGDVTSRAAESTLGALGAATQPLGPALDEAARSNIPVVDPFAEAVRYGWENVAEPIFNATPALLGTLAGSVDTKNSLNPVDWRYNRAFASQGWNENDPDQVYQQVYQEQLAAGKSEQEALERAAREREKMYNPLNREFKAGTRVFSTFNPVAQLGVGLFDPVQNLGGRAFIGKPLEVVGGGIGKAAEATGIPQAIGKKLESPQQYNATIARENYFAQQVLGDAEAQLGSPDLARAAVFEQPDSPFYWEKQGIHPEVAQGAQYFLEAERQANAPVDNALAPTETKIPQSESDFARQLQDTNPPPAPEATPELAPKADPFSLPETSQLDTTVPKPNELDEFFPESTRAARQARTPVDITDIERKAIGIPGKAATHDEFLYAVQQKLGYDRKAPAFKMAGTVGKPYLVETKPLEQFGAAGKIINALGATMPFMSRAYLNSSGRAMRDTAGNLVKYVAEGFGLDRTTGARFERITGSKDTAPLGRASVAAEVGKQVGNPNLATNVFYHVINPFNELSSDILRKLTGGKFKDWNDFTEKNESSLKTFAYKREFLKRFDAAVDSRVNSGQLSAELGKHIQQGTLTPELLTDYIKGQLPKGSSLADALAKQYNPLNVSDSVRAQLNQVLAGHAGPVGEVLRTALDTLQSRLEASNAAKRAQYEKAIAKLDRRPTRDPRKAEANRKTLMAVYQQTRPDKLSDITPDHPIWKQMEKDVLDNFTVAQKAADAVEKADPKIQLAVRNQIYQTLVWAAKDGKLQNLKRVLARDITRREQAGDFSQYDKHSEITPQAAAPDVLANLKSEVLAYGKLPNRSFPANKVLAVLEGKGAPGDVVVRYEKDGVTHFRVTAPDKLREGEAVAWPEQAPSQPQPAPQAPAVPVSSNPDVAYQKRAAVERNLRDLLFKEGKRPKAVDELRNSPLKGRTSEEYMAALWDAARKDGLSEDGVWQAAGQQRPVAPASTPPVAQFQPWKISNRLDMDTVFRNHHTNDPLYLETANGTKVKFFPGPFNFDLGFDMHAVPDLMMPGGNFMPADVVGRILDKDGKVLFDRTVPTTPQPKPAAPSDPLSDFSQGTRYHGTSQAFDELKPGYDYDQSANLYGPGLYTTDNLDIARSYTKKGGGANPAVYKVDWTGPNKPNLLNLEKPFPEELRQGIADYFSDDSVGFSPEFDWSKPAKDLYGDFKQALVDREGPSLTTQEAQEILYELADQFRQAGYDGFSHVGGSKAGKGKVTPHNVAVLFDPKNFDNGNKVALSRHEEPAAQPLPEATPGIDLQAFAEAVGRPPALRLPVDDGFGNVLTPETMRKMVGKWNRAETFTDQGNVYNGPLTPEQRAQFRRDFLATDEYYRRESGNTFKLDLDTFSPVRIEDGISLDELQGRSRAATIGEPLPQFPPEFPTDPAEVVKVIEQVMGADAYKSFAKMKKEGDQAGIDMAYSDIARAMGFPDPTEVRTASGKIGAETDQARAYLKTLADDARQRKAAADTAQGLADTATATYQKQAEDLARQILATRSQLVGEAGRGAYDKIESTYFDYQNKNVLDQMVGSVLPFGYWSRRNFAYVAKYFAGHPAQFAAVLNFYKNIEAQNQAAGGIPNYALGNLLLWTNPDGSKVMWNFNTSLPFNPLGDGESMLQLVGPDDDSKTANKTPLAMLFGADRVNSQGKVTGRDKGLLSTFLRPNPVIDILTKTGKVNEIMKDAGWVTDGFGSPDPSDLRGQRQTVGLIPGRTQIRDIAARTGLTNFLRTELAKAGIKLNDLDLEGPINNLLFGTNAGKPLTAVYNELTEMAQGDPKNKEKYLMALARLKEGNWDPVALKALDTVEAQTAWQRAASLAGFSSVIANTPREQLAGALYGGYGQVAGDKGRYEVTATDPKTGYQTRTYIPGESSKFFENNAGANVLFAKNKEPDKIIEGVGDDATYTEVARLNKAYHDDKTIDLRTFNKGMDDLRRGNPTYFKVAKDKDYQQAKGELPYLPGEKQLSVAEVDKKYAKQEQTPDRLYAEKSADFYAIGGQKYDDLAAKVSELYDQKRNKEAYALQQNPVYKNAKAQRDAYLVSNPDFAARYKAENEAKYGPSKTSTSSSTSTSNSSSNRVTYANSSSGRSYSTYTPKKTTASYAKSTAYKQPAKNYNTQNRSTNTNTKNKTVTSPAGYVNPFKLPATDARNPFFVPGKTAAPTSRTSFNGTAYPARSSTPAPSAASGGSSNSEWDANQKRAYAQQIGKGKSKSYAAKVANNYYGKKPWES
jgi:hypothetical protein